MNINEAAKYAAAASIDEEAISAIRKIFRNARAGNQVALSQWRIIQAGLGKSPSAIESTERLMLTKLQPALEGYEYED